MFNPTDYLSIINWIDKPENTSKIPDNNVSLIDNFPHSAYDSSVESYILNDPHQWYFFTLFIQWMLHIPV